jgi:peptide-methionine (S)-S-oxide reductase
MAVQLFSILIFLLSWINSNASEGMKEQNRELEIATLGAGCFWCIEAVFERVKGVESVVSGYSGGNIKNPSYREVTTGLTGHAEVAQIKFDSEIITFTEILEIFWKTHDPTTLNRQGADVGSQYRSAIFYHDANQKLIAETYKDKLNAVGAFRDPVVTEIVPFEIFYVAEDYHQEYYEQNANQPYCQYVIAPKLEKLEAVFADKLKN